MPCAAAGTRRRRALDGREPGEGGAFLRREHAPALFDGRGHGVADLLLEGAAFAGQPQARYPAVGGVGVAVHQVAAREPVGQAGDVRLVAAEQLGQLAERGFAALQYAEDLGLLNGQLEAVGHHDESRADLPVQLHECPGEVGRPLRRCHRSKDYAIAN
ncbi:hypothetical protein GCM10027570_28430 [Streptomonospora sediminis]